MPSRHSISRLVCALALLALAGCYSPYRYAPYSPYGSGIPMYNQGVPVQQFGPPVGSPTPVYPNGTFPPSGSQFNNGGLSPTPDPAGGGTFPPSNNNGFGPPTSGGGFNSNNLPPTTGGSGLVPNEGYYGDPGNLPSSGTGSFGNENITPFGPDGANFQRDSSTEAVSRVQYEPGSRTRELQLTAHQTSPPETFTKTEPFTDETLAVRGSPNLEKKPNPYGYDAVGYRWLRGIVDFDESQKAWVLIYNPVPGPNDSYQGQITLIDNGQLRKLKNNSVVLVEGQVETTSRDPGTGKPQYRVQTLHGPLVPKSVSPRT
jgi:hypothetical protein